MPEVPTWWLESFLWFFKLVGALILCFVVFGLLFYSAAWVFDIAIRYFGAVVGISLIVFCAFTFFDSTSREAGMGIFFIVIGALLALQSLTSGGRG